MALKKPQHASKPNGLLYLMIAWTVVLLAVSISILAAESGKLGGLKSGTYSVMGLIVSFSSFIATSFFGISIYHHNASMREQNAAIRNQTTAVNRRAELFRNLQFIASNYTVIDFIDYMKLYEESERYTAKLKTDGDFNFYLLQGGITKEQITSDFDAYDYLTLKIPFKIIEGKTIGKLLIQRIKFVKDDKEYRFFPATPDTANCLILYNELQNRQETVINLAVRKGDGFYTKKQPMSFLKVKLHLKMESLLGVVVSGAIELYISNPDTASPDKTYEYKINSSQFEVTGTPKLNVGKEFDINNID